MGPGPRRALFTVATLAVVVACRQLVGIGDAPPMGALVDSGPAEEGSDAGGCGIAYAGASCEACLESNCCPEATACAGHTACNGLEVCLGACDGGDPACRAQCVAGHRLGPDPFETQLAACLARSCAAPCGIPCGPFAQLAGVDAAPGCETCVENSVCNASLACAGQPGCQAILWCTETTYDLDREQACLDGYRDAGIDAALAFRSSLLTSCLGDCALGSQWYCVGHLAPPQESSQDTAVTLTLYDIFTNKPLVGAEVDVCSRTDSTCTPVITSATSDVDGKATVTVPSNVGGLGASGYLKISEPNLLVPELIFWGFPLSEPTLADTIGTFTTAEATPSALTSVLGVPVDLTSHALVVVSPLDCQNVAATGVTFSVSSPDPGTQVLYVTSTGGFSTDAGTSPAGLALIVNVPVGSVTVTATPRALGRPSSVVSGFTWAGTVTALGAPANQ